MTEALQASTVELLHAATVDHVSSHARCDVPHMPEGDPGKLAPPADGQGNTTDGRHQLVAAALATIEALVGAAPHTLYGVGAIGLAQNFVKANLKGEREA